MQINECISNLIKSLEGSTYYTGQDCQDMLTLLQNDYLSNTGYIESISNKLPLRHGLPIPWITYSALEFLESNVSTNAKVLEFGAGFSSIFWALRGNDISYLDFNKNWNDCIQDKSTDYQMKYIYISNQGKSMFFHWGLSAWSV